MPDMRLLMPSTSCAIVGYIQLTKSAVIIGFLVALQKLGLGEEKGTRRNITLLQLKGKRTTLLLLLREIIR
jgi:hypothetical protein